MYRRRYEQYAGPVTPAWSRFLVLTRYALRGVFRSRWMVVFFILALVPTLVQGAMIYIRFNSTALELFGPEIMDIIAVDAQFFQDYLAVQTVLCWILAAFVGPGLVSPDLANGALPLYFCRPLSRSEYVLGKGGVLFIVLSALTWIPGFMLIALQSAYAGMPWFSEHVRVPFVLFFSSCLWIIPLALLALALSAWVKWRMVAGALLFGVIIVLGTFGLIINEAVGTYWGSLIDMRQVWTVITHYLMHGEALRGTIPVWSAIVSLTMALLFSLWLLNRRVQAYEVVR
ncbi:MAG TPA: hypothetical protein VLU25_06230 [Acidobacteriota bacterium]|nr:hypothetical protein [Acidobacteriota bacterium]